MTTPSPGVHRPLWGLLVLLGFVLLSYGYLQHRLHVLEGWQAAHTQESEALLIAQVSLALQTLQVVKDAKDLCTQSRRPIVAPTPRVRPGLFPPREYP